MIYKRISLLAALVLIHQIHGQSIEWQFSGEIRGRYETLDGQFRSNKTGGDQGFFMRSLFHLKAVNEKWTAGVEIQDSRSYLTDSGSAISNSYVNSADFLQAYVEIPVSGFLSGDYLGSLKIGRQTVSIGSKRQIERVSFANVIKAYTGGHLRLKNNGEDEWHAFVVSPVDRQPDDFDQILDNRHEFDQEEFNRIIWGLHYRNADAFPELLPDTWGEIFAYGLYERDAFGNESLNRRYLTPGFRIYRKKRVGLWNYDIEGALRFGSRRATSAPADTTDLDVFASMLLFRLGYTFDHTWEPNFAFQWYWASGDDDPNDGDFDQYERLFGGRRTDLNNTSLHGPLTPANLSAAGFRFEMLPTVRSTFRATYSAAFLASDTDSFIQGKQRDPGGGSGNFLGHVFDTRFTYQFDKNWGVELGASLFIHEDFTRNNPQAPAANYTSFLYSQLTYTF
ncbi:MAG: alginate export family protein [Verrucomicrobia bacterium]|nr:alginate export family protein [Verrucomicrobiota bacterium]